MAHDIHNRLAIIIFNGFCKVNRPFVDKTGGIRYGPTKVCMNFFMRFCFHELLEGRKPSARATENFSARVYSQIKNLILCNEVLPGRKLRHQEPSDRVGASRTPEREALTRLAREGYVSILPKRAFTCKEIRLQEAAELYDLREANVLADLKQRQETRELQSAATIS